MARQALLEDENNAGVAYIQGPWLFRMLEDAMGRIGFQEAIAEYSGRSLVSPAGWELLAECSRRHAPADFDARSFLWPWLTERRAPHLTTQIAGQAVTIRQEPSVFEFSSGCRGFHRAGTRASPSLDQRPRNGRHVFRRRVRFENRSRRISSFESLTFS
jgi:hypothetical protein